MRFLPMFVIVLFALTSGYLTLAEHDSPSGKPMTQHLVWDLHAIILGTLIPLLLLQSQQIRALEDRLNRTDTSRDVSSVAADAEASTAADGGR